ncbi:MAG TPA: hypothetical protein PLL33_10000 [Paracoccus sp. (in: a-proteobacteria)]|nr:hypothetical protein [Paracoccus sp. (in: a-proteobacteria)]
MKASPMRKTLTCLFLTCILTAAPALAQTATTVPPAEPGAMAGTAPAAGADAPADGTAPADPRTGQTPSPGTVIPDPAQMEPEQTPLPQTTQQALQAPGSAPAEGAAPVPDAAAQTPPSNQSTAGAANNGSAGVATAATPSDKGVPDGTAPGNSGSTGFTGGLGGSMIGTNPSGAVPESRTWQPPTARGLDLRG